MRASKVIVKIALRRELGRRVKDPTSIEKYAHLVLIVAGFKTRDDSNIVIPTVFI